MEDPKKSTSQEGADYEKKYKELVGKIEKAYLYAQTDSTKAVLKEIHPELSEGENEKIRRDIISYIQVANQVLPQFQKDNWIAWLEKQAPKPKWTDEDEENFRDIIGAIHSVAYQPTEDEEARISWIKSIKQRLEEQQ